MAASRGWGAALRGAPAVYSTFNSVRQKWGGNATWVVGTNVEYSVYVEFGTSKMGAQPYFRPAIEHAKRNSAAWFKAANDIAGFVKKVALEIERYAKQVVPVDTGNLRASIRAERIR